MFKDRMMRGALAGVIASFSILIWNLFSDYYLHFAKKTWLEALCNLVMGHSIENRIDFIIAICLLLIWNGFLGVIFVKKVIPKQDGSYIGRAITYNFIVWFILYSIGTMFKINSFHTVAWQTVISNWIGLIFYGIILGWLTKRWDELNKP